MIKRFTRREFLGCAGKGAVLAATFGSIAPGAVLGTADKHLSGSRLLLASAGADARTIEADGGLSWDKSAKRLTLLRGGQTVWSLHYDPDEGKPYFHPLCAPDGTDLTWLRPPDHPWHRALWFSWKYINGLNYWEEDRKTGLSEGRTDVLKVEAHPRRDGSASLVLHLTYHPPKKPPVLTELRHLHVSAPDGGQGYTIDWSSTFIALTAAKLDRTGLPGEKDGKSYGGYAGFSVRMAPATRGWKFTSSAKGTLPASQIHGTRARWMDYSGQTPKGNAAGLAIFDGPGNLRFPSHWYVNAPMPYFSPAVLWQGPYTLRAGESLTLRYRVWVHGQAGTGAIRKAYKQFVRHLEARRGHDH